MIVRHRLVSASLAVSVAIVTACSPSAPNHSAVATSKPDPMIQRNAQKFGQWYIEEILAGKARELASSEIGVSSIKLRDILVRASPRLGNLSNCLQSQREYIGMSTALGSGAEGRFKPACGSIDIGGVPIGTDDRKREIGGMSLVIVSIDDRLIVDAVGLTLVNGNSDQGYNLGNYSPTHDGGRQPLEEPAPSRTGKVSSY